MAPTPSSPPKNHAAYQPSKAAPSLAVRTAPYPNPPAAGQMIIRARAVAINPIDTFIQSRGALMYTHLHYPFVLGYDVAGEVLAVGAGVTRFRPGDRVLAYCPATDEDTNDPAMGAFQEVVLVREELASELPEAVGCERGAVLPLTVITAAAALFDPAQLGLRSLPSEPRAKATGETVVVWGSSTSVGCNAVQLAVAAGYEVLATAGVRNHEMVRRLGAKKVWDYKSLKAVAEIVAALREEGRTLAGVVSIGVGADNKCIQIVSKVQKGERRVAMATYPVPDKDPENLMALRIVSGYLSSLVSYKIRSAMRGFKYSLVVIKPTLENGIARHIFQEFLPKALAARSYVTAPEPEVVGHGLENIQTAFERLRKGVSGKKLVVTL